MALIRMEYPAWHDEARARNAKGESQPQLADAYGISRGRMSQIATPNWKAYIILWRLGSKAGGGVGEMTKRIDAYEFVPVDTPLPTAEKRDEWAKKWSKKQETPEMPREREFEPIKKYADGRTVVGSGITCSKCGKIGEFFHNKGGKMPAVFLSKEFTKMEWIVGGAPRADLCPDCSKALRTHRKDEYVMPTVKSFKDLVDTRMSAEHHEQHHEVLHLPAIPPEPAPASVTQGPDKLVRRMIFAKLNDIYIDENSGYAGDWDDAKTAEDLGVSVEWVKLVRDADFGPEINAIKRQETFKALTDMFGRLERLAIVIEAKIKHADGLSDKINEAIANMHTAKERFDELVENLNTQDDQIVKAIEQFRADAEALKELKKELVPGTIEA